jgi:Rieske 2Fe-2S family protein
MSATQVIAAPLERAGLERVLDAPFGMNLPQEAYVSSEVYEWELDRLWAGGWVCIGRADDLARPGDQKAVRAGNDGIVLVRGDDRVLRGFYNVCRHRAHELLPPGACAHTRSILCSYHGWAYELDGRLKVAPHTGNLPGFDPAAHGLVAAPVEVWHGWVFVNASAAAPPLAEWVGDLEELARDHEPERLRPGAEKSYEVAANWKLVHENFHECYHCTHIHPQLCKVSPPDSGRNFDRRGAWVGGTMDLADHAATMSLDGQSSGVPLRGLRGPQLRRMGYYGLVPNLFISLHPDYVLTHRLEPLGPGRTRIECQWLFPPEAFAKEDFSPQYAFEFWDLTNLQDWKAIESVQRGIASRGYRPGPLTSREDAVQRFVTRIARAYLEGRFDPAASRPER